MKIELSTDLLPIVKPDTYGIGLDVYEECVDDVKQMMMNLCGDYIKEALDETDFYDATVTMKEFKSPQYYNFETDWCLFDLEFNDDMVDKIKTKADDDFYKWSKEKYKSYDGFISFAPLGKENYLKALDAPLQRFRYQKEYAISMWIMYQLKDYPDKQEEYDQDVMEKISQSGWEVDYEEADCCEC